MGILPGHWYYNTESGQLTHGNNLENLGNNLFGGMGWHELNISGNATADQAAAEARREFPNGATPTNAGITVGRIASGAAQAAKNAVTGNSGSSGNATACLINLPVIGCVLAKTQARALIAGLIIGVSGVVGVVGLALLTVEALQRTGAADAAGSTLEHVGAGLAFVPGLEGAGIATAGVGAAAKRAGSKSGASQSIQRRQRGRDYRAQEARQQQREAEQREHRERGTETTTVRERTPISGEMGGTRDTTRTVRRPGPRREGNK